MKVAIYSRFSTDQQDVTSIAGQVANCEALAAREGLTVVAKYDDEGISGNDDSRPGYRALLDDLAAGKFGAFLCDETSRITRNQSELHRLVAELGFRDQFIITCDGIDTRCESSELLLSVKAAVDSMESKKIGNRVYRANRERHKAGYSAGGKIYGYTSVTDGEYKRRVIDPQQAEVVKEIFDRYVGGESARTIARSLNERGIRSPGSYYKNARSNGWPHTTILGSSTKSGGILRNPIYKGLATWNKRAGKRRPGTGKRIQKLRPECEWEQHQDESLRIVADEVWQKAQQRLCRARDAHAAKQRAGRPPKYLLSGLLKCESCGGNYVVRNSRSYCCSSHTNGRDVFCEQTTYIKRDDIERELLGGIKEQLLESNIKDEMAKAIRKEANALKTSKPAAKEQIATLDRQIDNTVASLVMVGASEALTSKLRDLEQQKREVEKLLNAPEPAKIILGASEKWAEVVSDLENLRNHATPDEIETARELLRNIIGEVSIKEKPSGVWGYTKLNTITGYNNGAQRET